MYHRPEVTLEQYELDIIAITKGRDCYICETDRGTLILKEYRRSKERLAFYDAMLNHLKNEGIPTEALIRTKEGELFAEGEDENSYILLTAVHGAECGTRDRDDVMEAVRALSRFRAAADSYAGEVPQIVTECASDPLLTCEKHNRELLKVRNYIRNKKKKNEFEVLFLSCYDEMADKAQSVTEHIRAHWDRSDICFCHGDYNQHNVIFARGGTAIVHLDNFCYDGRMSDLANFMRKILEKNNWNVGLGLDMVRAYNETVSMQPAQLAGLYGYIAYPEKFWKVANRYFNTHKAWLSGRSIEKLEKLIAQEKARWEFMEILFHFSV